MPKRPPPHPKPPTKFADDREKKLLKMGIWLGAIALCLFRCKNLDDACTKADELVNEFEVRFLE